MGDRPVVFGAPMIPDPHRLSSLIAEALAAGWLTNGGALHMRLEQALTTEAPGEDVVSLVSSGTMALMLALGLGNLPPGAEVITTPLSFAATVQAISWSGLIPVFADVEPDTLTLCPRAVRAALSPGTAALLPVHFLGVPCDVEALAGLARDHGLWLAYDAAHAFGLRMDGRPIGGFGDAAAFSLHATKILHSAEGGFVVTRRSTAPELRRMRNFGLVSGQPAGRGLNAKLSEMHAAMGLALLPDLPGEITARLALRRAYDAALSGVPGLRLHRTRPGATDSPAYYALRMTAALRSMVHLALAENGILARDHFPLLCGAGTPWPEARIATPDGAAPVAPRLGPELLCLPLHGRMTGDDVTRIATIIRTTLKGELA